MPLTGKGQDVRSKAVAASKEVSKEVSPDQKHWFQGSVAEAYTAAAKEKKHMILYWGAEWCPPCNDLKDQVFSHPEFPIFASRYIMVYLDGDSEGAQTWGEKLKVSGYPTVVLMDPKGKELFRFSSGMDFTEFKRSMTSAVASGKNFKSIVSNLNGSKPKLALEDWQTLSTSYMDQDALGLDDRGTEKLIEKSWLLCPADFELGKATFAASLWDHSLGEKSKLKETFKKNENLILEQILSSGSAMDAARNSLMMEPAKKIESLKPENRERVRQRMVTYMKDLASSPARAPSERAMALHSYLDLETLVPSSSGDSVKSGTLKSDEVQKVSHGIGIPKFDSEGRFVITEHKDFALYNIYFPNGAMGEDIHNYKMEFLETMYVHFKHCCIILSWTFKRLFRYRGRNSYFHFLKISYFMRQVI